MAGFYAFMVERERIRLRRTRGNGRLVLVGFRGVGWVIGGGGWG